jgi:hypothetical protein
MELAVSQLACLFFSQRPPSWAACAPCTHSERKFRFQACIVHKPQDDLPIILQRLQQSRGMDGMVSERRSGGVCQLIDTSRNRHCLSKFLTGRVTLVILLGLLLLVAQAYPNPLSRKAVSPLPKNQTKLKQFLIQLGILYCSSQCNIKFALKLQPLTLWTILRSPSPRLVYDQHSNISIQR